MLLNNNDLVDRNNRPGVQSKVGLRVYFVNDGEYVDPYDISSCTIFARSANLSPNSIMDDEDRLLDPDLSLTSVVMNFGISGTANAHTGAPGSTTSENLAWVSSTLYTPATNASGIYRISRGEYVAVLDGTLNLSGVYSGTQIANTASSVQEYIDVWTVKMFQGSLYQLFINKFKLYDDAVIMLTEPLLLTTSNRLVNKKITLGSKIDLKVTTDITVQNKSVNDEILNLFKNFGVSGATVKIEKINEDSTSLPARLPATGDSGTGYFTSATNTTSDNTILYTLDTTQLAANLLSRNSSTAFGGIAGTYALYVKYAVLQNIYVVGPMYFEVI
jgi:hypothetical protein